MMLLKVRTQFGRASDFVEQADRGEFVKETSLSALRDFIKARRRKGDADGAMKTTVDRSFRYTP